VLNEIWSENVDRFGIAAARFVCQPTVLDEPTERLGKQLGLPADFVPKVIAAVGNYGEVFDRNVGPKSPLKLDRGVNKQWKEGGLIYSPPFR
jgi:hypothetical protein